MKFILRRLGFYLIAAWASLTLNFLLPRLSPGDPATRLLGRVANTLRPEEIEALKKVYGIDDSPLIVQYFNYLTHAARGDLGISFSSFPTPVNAVIGTGLFWTLLLGAVALILGVVIGNLIGILAAWRRGGWIDTFLPPTFMFIGSFPYFWLAMLALYFFGLQLGWFPLNHAYGTGVTPGFNLEFIVSVVQHAFLPATTIVLVSLGGWMLGMRNTMISTLSEDYVTMAEAEGLPERKIMFGYAARNAMLPTVTSFGMALGFIVSGSLLTEIVFSYPGLGFQLIRAVNALDYPLLQGLLLMITVSVLAANFVIDLVYVRLDPRVRLR